MLHSDTQRVTCHACRAPADDPPLVELRDVVKLFPGVVALAGVDFRVAAGEIVGLVGKNGAGKSSLIKISRGSRSRTRASC